MSPARLIIGCALVVLFAAAMVGAPKTVDQLHRRFSIAKLHIAKGDTVRFNNIDEFLHQIFVDSPTFKFSSNEQSPGQVVDIVFPTKGTFEVRCEIHPKMLLSVVVE